MALIFSCVHANCQPMLISEISGIPPRLGITLKELRLGFVKIRECEDNERVRNDPVLCAFVCFFVVLRLLHAGFAEK